jgi:hypothetical protein
MFLVISIQRSYDLNVYGDCFYYKSNLLLLESSSEGRGVWINVSGNINISSGDCI